MKTRRLVSMFLLFASCEVCLAAQAEPARKAICEVEPIVDSPYCEDFLGTSTGRAFYACIGVGLREDCPQPPAQAVERAQKNAEDNCRDVCREKRCRKDREAACVREDLATKQRIATRFLNLDCSERDKPVACDVVAAGICTCRCEGKRK